MDLYLVNESTTLKDTDAFNMAWAVDYQLRFHYGRSGWRGDCRCYFKPGGASAAFPVGSAVLHLLDTLDVQGALGYHDEDGNEIPFGRIGVQTTLNDQGQVSEVVSHEAMELVTDPHLSTSAYTGDLSRLYPIEVGDACQGNAYDVGAPEGRTTGVVVADFCLPNYFDPNTKADAPTTFRGSLKGPFALGPKGYYSYLDLHNVAGGWQQQVGQERTSAPPPDLDDRFTRRVAIG